MSASLFFRDTLIIESNYLNSIFWVLTTEFPWRFHFNFNEIPFYLVFSHGEITACLVFGKWFYGRFG